MLGGRDGIWDRMDYKLLLRPIGWLLPRVGYGQTRLFLVQLVSIVATEMLKLCSVYIVENLEPSIRIRAPLCSVWSNKYENTPVIVLKSLQSKSVL